MFFPNSGLAIKTRVIQVPARYPFNGQPVNTDSTQAPVPTTRVCARCSSRSFFVGGGFCRKFTDEAKRVRLRTILGLVNCYITQKYISGQIIATSHDLTPNGGLVREIPLFQGNLNLARYMIQ